MEWLSAKNGGSNLGGALWHYNVARATLHQGVHTMHYSAELSLSPKVYISGEEGRKEAHLARYSCTIILVWENSRSGIRKVWQQCLCLSIHGECYRCSQPNRRNYPEEEPDRWEDYKFNTVISLEKLWRRSTREAARNTKNNNIPPAL